ncbi:hypothetical protein GCM10017691_60650 [Pseudonocardia petroleophila]|uniref:DUF2637 domain-containing protein n=1 Tax=Pseudonocardia petroleophila TaxID=37331 RepID=A0A7G7MMD9_9PSEU|nr:hypothetical protein [Pseudonocardia petroleophila]QNG53950.1 hypothetical protein H6H00_08555 [Pseudonocardia petroleophila]
MSGDEPGRSVRAAIWLPGLAVALGAAVATAHGLYEVAHAARVPAGIAWIYPLITDGLALVAYAATARLHGSAARYAWAVVVLAAGLSGLAQAVFLASGSAVDASPALRFGVGAWPAVAAAIVAHLLYLLATDDRDTSPESDSPAYTGGVQPGLFTTVQPEQPMYDAAPPVATGVRRSAGDRPLETRPALPSAPVEHRASRAVESPASDRARAAALRHAHRRGDLPSVTELAAIAEVSRGTAGTVLKTLREEPTPLHLITNDDDPTIEESTQP